MSRDYSVQLLVSSRSRVGDFLTGYRYIGEPPVWRELRPGSKFCVYVPEGQHYWPTKAYIDHVDFEVRFSVDDSVISCEEIQETIGFLVAEVAAEDATIAWQLTVEFEFLVGFGGANGIVVNSQTLGSAPTGRYAGTTAALVSALEARGLSYQSEDHGISIPGGFPKHPFLTPTPETPT